MKRSTRTRATSLPVAALLGVSTFGAVLVVEPAPASAAGVCAGPAAQWPEHSVKLASSTVPLGGGLTITGTGWCHPDGTGSRIGVKIDEGGISRLDTAVHANTTIWTVVDADANGQFTARIQMPDGTTGTSSPAVAAGEHSLRLLSGSMRSGDTGRSLATDTFTVTASGTIDPAPPAWPAQEKTSDGATVWVEDEVGTGDSATVRVRGVGWQKSDGTPSTVAVKLSSSSTDQFVRAPGEVIEHPTTAGDTTVWALFAPDAASQRHVFRMGTDGSFEATLDLPAGLADGDYLTVSVASGRFAAGDRTRSIHTRPLLVGGARGAEESTNQETCTPTSPTPTVQVPSAPVALGGTLRVTGTGWCHPAGGGSRIAFKIDEGAYSRLDSSVHSNRTIWAVVQAKGSDGSFSADLVLPDGTTRTSTPALTTGSHRLRLLSGSLTPGDASRTLVSAPFVVGSHRPHGTPEPFAAEDLVDRVRGGVAATVTGRRVSVFVPAGRPGDSTHGRPGDWVHLSAYLPNSSPTYPWGGRWYRLDAAGRVQVTVPATTPGGPVKLAVTSGNQGASGTLVGWDDIILPAPRGARGMAPQPQGKGSDATRAVPPATPATAPGPVTPATAAALIATPVDTPLSEPAPPAKNFVGVVVLDKHGVTSALTGSLLTVTFPGGRAGELVHTRVYGSDDVPAGWGMLTEAGVLMLDLKNLPTGTYRFAFQGTDGASKGWTEALWDPTGSAAGDEATTPDLEAAESIPVQQAGADWRPSPLDGVLLGVGVLAVAVSALTRRRTGGVA